MLSIVIPAYNEEKRIRGTIKNLKQLKEIKEMIVVCNGCTDRTPEIARSMGVKVIELPYRDKGRAVLEGLLVSKSNLIGFVDADGAFNSKSVHALLAKMEDNDAIIASKWRGQSFGEVHEPFNRKFGSRVWNLLTKLLLGLDFSDTQAGLKIMHKGIFEKIDTNFICTGFAFDVELLYKIEKSGGKIKEVYVPVHEVKKINVKKSSFSTMRTPSMLICILKLWIHEKLNR